MHKRIVAARAAVERAEAKLQAVCAEVQAKCEHAHVAESQGVGFGRIRICEDCGHEEHASRFPGSQKALGWDAEREMQPTTLNIDRIRPVSFDEAMRLRP